MAYQLPMVVLRSWFVCSLLVVSVSSDIRQDVEKLMNRIEMLEQSHKDLIKIVAKQQDLISKYEIKMERLTGVCGNDKLQTEKSDRENSVVQKRLSVSALNSVAFSAYINHFIPTLTPNEVIPFEMVTTNEGNAFDGNKGVFTCPESGLYLFVWNIMVDNGHGTQAKFIVNGATRRWSNAYSTGHYANAANHDIVRLEEGDKVWLADGYAAGEIHPHHTTFSGVLLFQ